MKKSKVSLRTVKACFFLWRRDVCFFHDAVLLCCGGGRDFFLAVGARRRFHLQEKKGDVFCLP